MNKYHNGKIYEIVSGNTDMCYVGSCIDTLTKRLAEHKHKNNSTASKQIIDFGDCRIVLLEDYKCENRKELRIREQYWIDKYRLELKNIINKLNAYTSPEDAIMKHKVWIVNNKEKVSLQRKAKYQKNKEWIKDTNYLNKYGDITSEYALALV